MEKRHRDLLVGCVDARLIRSKIGASDGDIVRTLGAYVPAPNERGGREMQAALEYSILHDKIDRIVVMPHSGCGAVGACVHEPTNLPKVVAHMAPLKGFRDQSLSKFKQARHLEQDIARISIDNLMQYDVVKDAVKTKALTLEGWFYDVRDHKVHRGLEKYPPGKYLPELDIEAGEFPEHKPKLLVFGCSEAKDNLHNLLPNGMALFVRSPGAVVPHASADLADRSGTEALLEFATKGLGIQRIVALGDVGCGACACGCETGHSDMPALNAFMAPLRERLQHAATPQSPEATALNMTLDHLRSFDTVKEAGDKVRLDGWLYQPRTKEIYALDRNSGQFGSPDLEGLGVSAVRR